MSIIVELQSIRPKAIDPLRVQAFLYNAQQIIDRPDLAHLLSKYANSNRDLKRSMKAFSNGKFAIYSADHEDDEDEDDDESPKGRSFKPTSLPYVMDGIGCIPIDGVIGKGLSPLEQMLGCVDIDRVRQCLDAWKDRADVMEILFKFDTGGGTTTGLQELAKQIRTYPKPTIAYTETNCGSAGYWLASQCNRLVCTPSSELGAVGIYLTITDESAKYEEDGKQVLVIKSGEYKGSGIAGTSLSERQLANLQEEVTELHRRFISDVKAVRQFADEADLQGQTFYGDIAVRRGLATANVDSFKELIEGIKAFRSQMSKTLIPSAYGASQTVFSPPTINRLG
jgi:ClpP class serine protease